jgi:RND family efflux transporter MFP subunit
MSRSESHAAEQAARLESLRIERRPAPERSTHPRWGWWLLVLALLLAVLVAAWWWGRTQALAVEIATVRDAQASGAAASVLDATGYVTARRKATVSAKVTGKIRAVLVEEGQRVEAGEVLAYIDDATEQAQLELARAQLASASAELDELRALLTEAEQNLRRTRELAERQLVSQRELDAAVASTATLQARLATAGRNIQVAERGVTLRQRQLDDYTIRAPFSGIVIDKNAQPGEMISAISAGGGFTRTGICTIVDMDSLEIEVDVNEAFIQRVRAGQRVSAALDAYPDQRIPAEVTAIVPAADREKATVRVRIGFLERDVRILPDMGVKVRFLEAEAAADRPRQQGVLVPAGAVRSSNGVSHLFVVVEGVAQRREVEIAERNGNQARIAAGLSAGERVILNPPAELADGMAVQARNR